MAWNLCDYNIAIVDFLLQGAQRRQCLYHCPNRQRQFYCRSHSGMANSQRADYATGFIGLRINRQRHICCSAPFTHITTPEYSFQYRCITPSPTRCCHAAQQPTSALARVFPSTARFAMRNALCTAARQPPIHR